MALTDSQRAEVRRYLGYSDLSAGLYSTLEGAMAALSAAGVAQVAIVLADLAAIEARLRSSWTRQAVIKAEDVTLAGRDEILALRQEGSRLAGMLASIFGVEVQRSVFTSGAASGQAGRG